MTGVMEKPWVPTTLSQSTKKTSLVDDIAELLKQLWDDNVANAVALASSTDSDDAVEGSVAIDKILLARLIKEAAGENSRVGKAKVGDIAKVMHHAAKRYGVDRKSIAAKKAEFLALEQQGDTAAADPAFSDTPVAE